MSRQQSHERPLAELVAELEREGVTSRQEQADRLGCGYSTLMRHLKEAGVRQRPSLGDWIPWTVATEHHSTLVGANLRILAQAAQGRQTRHRLKRGQAVRWATGLVEKGLDVTYSRDEGFSLVTATPHDWYVKRLLDAAVHYILSLPQLDDLGKDSN